MKEKSSPWFLNTHVLTWINTQRSVEYAGEMRWSKMNKPERGLKEMNESKQEVNKREHSSKRTVTDERDSPGSGGGFVCVCVKKREWKKECIHLAKSDRYFVLFITIKHVSEAFYDQHLSQSVDTASPAPFLSRQSLTGLSDFSFQCAIVCLCVPVHMQGSPLLYNVCGISCSNRLGTGTHGKQSLRGPLATGSTNTHTNTLPFSANGQSHNQILCKATHGMHAQM